MRTALASSARRMMSAASREWRAPIARQTATTAARSRFARRACRARSVAMTVVAMRLTNAANSKATATAVSTPGRAPTAPARERAAATIWAFARRAHVPKRRAPTAAATPAGKAACLARTTTLAASMRRPVKRAPRGNSALPMFARRRVRRPFARAGAAMAPCASPSPIKATSCAGRAAPPAARAGRCCRRVFQPPMAAYAAATRPVAPTAVARMASIAGRERMTLGAGARAARPA